MEKFTDQEYRDFVKIDFMHDESARAIFDQDFDPKRIIRQIELRQGREINPQSTLIIFRFRTPTALQPS